MSSIYPIISTRKSPGGKKSKRTPDLTALKSFRQSFDKLFIGQYISLMTNEDLKQPVTKEYLGEYTEQVILPGIAVLLDEKLKPLEDKIDALSSKVTTHLELSDKRYLELKNREKLLAKWIKQIADKTGVEIDLAELEKF